MPKKKQQLPDTKELVTAVNNLINELLHFSIVFEYGSIDNYVAYLKKTYPDIVINPDFLKSKGED